jgi:hypothetical protein
MSPHCRRRHYCHRDAVDAFDQPFELRPIELIGTAETMHHMGLSPLGVGVPDALGEGIVGDARAVAVVTLVMRRYMPHE